MSLILSGSDGLSDVDGSASTPAIRGTDANTGIFFPAADTIGFSEGGTEVLRVDSSGNLQLRSAGTSILNSSGNRILQQTGSVLQVVSTIKTDSFSLAATNTFTDITGLSVAITPTSSSSRVLVTVSVGGASMSAGGTQAYRLVRDSTAIGVGTAAGSRQATSWRDFNGSSDGNAAYGGYTFTFLDSPSTTSSTTYKLQVAVQTGTGYINRSPNDTDTDAPWGSRPASTITVMEIAA